MLLNELLEETGASGNEARIKNLILKEIRKHVKDVDIDKFGNIIAHKKGAKPTVMLVAHMDEIGLMVKAIEDNGNIRISEIGGIEVISLIGQRVGISAEKGKVRGVVTLPEINDDAGIRELPALADIIVDTGLTRRELNKLGVTVGSFIEFEQKAEFLGNSDFITCKALDDRIGCYMLLEMAKRLKKSSGDIYYVFTVQEEVGLYGAKTSAYEINPDWAVVLDVTNAEDSEEDEDSKKVGAGPCITIKDADMISNVCIDQWLKTIAKKNRIPIQLDVSDRGTTDALSISVSRGGVPTSVLGVAVRNLHTNIGVASLDDIEHGISLLTSLLMNPPKVCIA